MYSENELAQLSALQHIMFCERQCALIHLEMAWSENRFTMEGKILHEKVHGGDGETRNGVRIARAVALRSLELGVSGQADVVEFYKDEETKKWRPFPVEYKRGKPKEDHADLVQLCAQAICLEEMLGVKIPAGAIFYGKTRRRLDVEFSEELKRETAETARRLHDLIKAGKTPKAVYTEKCESCSIKDLCVPKMFERGSSVGDYIEEAVLCPKN